MKRPLVFLIFALALLLSAGNSSHAQEKKLDEAYKKLRIEKPETKAVRDFRLEDLSGKRIRLRDLKGKVIFLNFWATWCGPCRAEMPAMEKLYREFKDSGLEMLAVNIMESRETVRRFASDLGLTFTILLDRDGRVAKAYGAWALPTTYVINRRGELVGRVRGPRQWDSGNSKDFFRGLLAQNR